MIWPLASSPERARWAAKAVERYLHMTRSILTRAAAWPARQAAIPAQALDLARRLYDAIEHWVDELGRPPRPDVLCASRETMAQNSEKQRRGRGRSLRKGVSGNSGGRAPECLSSPKTMLACVDLLARLNGEMP
jgi:hypothetical protein